MTKKKSSRVLDQWLKLLVVCLVIFLLIFTPESLFNRNGKVLKAIFQYLSVVILISAIYLIFKKSHRNIGTFCIFLTFQLLILPIIQLYLYQNNKNHFVHNQEFIDHKKTEIALEIEELGDIKLVKDLLYFEDISHLNARIPNHLIGRTYKIGDINILVTKSNDNRPSRKREEYLNKYIKIYQNEESISMTVKDESLKSALKRTLNYSATLNKMYKHPNLAIEPSDLWIECVSGFLLGNIKPISNVSQIIQLVQLFILFVLAIIISDIFISSNRFLIKKKNT